MYRQVGDTAAIHFHQVSSKSGFMGPSYGQKTVSSYAEDGGVSEGLRPPHVFNGLGVQTNASPEELKKYDSKKSKHRARNKRPFLRVGVTARRGILVLGF